MDLLWGEDNTLGGELGEKLAPKARLASKDIPRGRWGVWGIVVVMECGELGLLVVPLGALVLNCALVGDWALRVDGSGSWAFWDKFRRG